MNAWITFLQDWLGASWRTALLGVVLLILSLPCIGAGAVLMAWELTRSTGLALMGQGVIMATAGVGFMMTRDNKASEEAHQESLDKIAKVKEAVKEEVKEDLQRDQQR